MTLSWHIEHFDQVESTQDLIKEYAAKGGVEGRVVIAEHQTRGRGRHGREWVSHPGNLYFSFLLKPQMNSQNIGQLGLVIAVALGRAVKSFLRAPEILKLKWPNDILLDGKKCAGILIETELGEGGQIDWVAFGIGLNTKDAPEEGACLGTHISAQTGNLPDNEEVLHVFLQSMNEYYRLWQSGDFQAILSSWLAMAHEKGAEVTVKLGEKILHGTFEGVDESGALLLLNSEDKVVQTITAGEIYL